MLNNIIIILIIILIIIIIWYILFKIIFYKIENFDDTSSTIDSSNYYNIMKEYDVAYPNYNIPINIQNICNSSETVVKHIISTNQTVNFNIYTNNTDIDDDTKTSDYYSRLEYLFTNNDLDHYITFKNTISYFFIINFINGNQTDANFYITTINIAIQKNIFNDPNNIDNITFYNCSNSQNNVINNKDFKKNYTKIQPTNYKVNTNNDDNRIIILTYTFPNILINNIWMTINNISNTSSINIYYINFIGISEFEYININNANNSASNSGKVITLGTDVVTSELISGRENEDNNMTYSVPVDYTPEILATRFNLIINNKTPWAAYNGPEFKSINNRVILPNLLGNKCRDAIIYDTKQELLNNSISTEDTTYIGNDINGIDVTKKCNIKHLKGSTNMKILFPLGSLPPNYTICAITRYTNPNGNRDRILTANTCCNPVNLLIGHYNNQQKLVHNMGWKSTLDDIQGDTNWVISCVKRTGNRNNINKKYNTVLFNGKAKGSEANIGVIANNSILTINYMNGYPNTTSDFGLAYLLIWDQILTDQELDIVSKNLINCVIDNTYKLPLKDMNYSVNGDGLTASTAADNAFMIKNNICNYINNYYYIKINNIPKKIYCILNDDINSVYGGGWMLAMKGAKYTPYFNPKTFTFGSSHWTTSTVLYETSYPDDILNDTTTEIKTDIFNYYKFSEILIIFNDPIFSNNKYYKTSYYKLQANNYSYSLLDFFANNIYDFIACHLQYKDLKNINPLNATNSGYRSIMTYSKYSYNDFLSTKRLALGDPNGVNYTTDAFAQQSICGAYGINLNFKQCYQTARIGAIFNENDYTWFNSSDVSCGIGLNGPYASGNNLSCCQSAGPPTASYPFLLFVR